MTLQRCLSLFVALCVALCVVCLNGVPVFATETNLGGWIELLETTSVQSNGENWFVINGQSTTVTIPLQTETRLVKIDALIWHQTMDYLAAASVVKGSSTSDLKVLHIENNLTRIYGSIPTAYYEDISIKFSKPTSGNSVWQLLSCKVTPISKMDYDAQARLWIDGDSNNTMDLPGNFTSSGIEGSGTYEMQVPILVYDWAKFDEVTVFGSLSYAGLNSVRASVGTTGLPYEMTYTNTNATGYEEESYSWSEMKYYSYDESYKGTVEENSYISVDYGGKVLYTITVDLSGLDRTQSATPLIIYFTMVVNEFYGYKFNVQGVTGSIETADTSSVTWWFRFTRFMENLFVSDDDTDMIQNVVGQSQEVAEDRLGAVAQAGDVINDLTGAFQNHGVMETITFPSLTINFGSVPWTFGGWDVSVIPPGFESLVELLKVLIDIVATLAFVHAMRARFEKLLAGGNA